MAEDNYSGGVGSTGGDCSGKGLAQTSMGAVASDEVCHRPVLYYADLCRWQEHLASTFSERHMVAQAMKVWRKRLKSIQVGQ